MPKVTLGATPLYAGTWDCAKKTVTREGVTGLYKGAQSMLIFKGFTALYYTR